MESITRFITQKLKLKVNEAKSAVARPQERKFLGFSFTAGPDIKRTIAPKSLERFKQRIREITRRAKGVSMKTTMDELAPYMRGWRGYFGFCETPEVLIALTRWVRLRLRAALWRQWKTPRRRRAALIALRVFGQLCNTADSGRGPWHIARSKALSVGLKALDATPVVFPPGRARLTMKPVPTGSETPAMTVGIVRVAFCRASTAALLLVSNTSTP